MQREVLTKCLAVAASWLKWLMHIYLPTCLLVPVTVVTVPKWSYAMK